MAPTHVIDAAGAPTTRCGIKTKTDEALPLVLARFVPMHVKGRGMELCLTCGMFLTVEHHEQEVA